MQDFYTLFNDKIFFSHSLFVAASKKSAKEKIKPWIFFKVCNKSQCPV